MGAESSFEQSISTSTGLASIFSAANGFDTTSYGVPTVEKVTSSSSSDDSPACDSTCLGLAIGLPLGLGLPLIGFLVYMFCLKGESGHDDQQNIIEMPRPEG